MISRFAIAFGVFVFNICASAETVPSTALQNSLYSRSLNTADNAPLASIDKASGRLFYGTYANEREERSVHMLPDFSWAGYMGGGVALPAMSSIPVVTELSPDGAADDYQRIQTALDAVSRKAPDARGIRGAVLLGKGEYQISDTLRITQSGVVLRGEGQGKDGTVLIATTTHTDARFLVIEGEGRGRSAKQADEPRVSEITQAYVPVGSNSVTVASAAGYSVGDTIGIERRPNQQWVGSKGINTARFGWKPKSYNLVFERTVTAIVGNTITFDIPMVDTIDARFGGGRVYRTDTSGRLQQVGLENLRLETLEYKNRKRRDRAFFAVSAYEVENSWIRNVTVETFSHGFNLYDGVRFMTIQNAAHLAPGFEVVGGNHYAFNIGGAAQVLFQRCFADKSRHAFTSGSRVQGPNVFLDCLAERSDSDSGPHHRWATGTLFDNLKGVQWRAQNRADAGSGHGWAGAQQLLWNSEFNRIVVQAPPYAMNYAIHNAGSFRKGSREPNEADGIIDNRGRAILPRSLYLAQLQDRLGAHAVVQVTYAPQRQGRIWSALSNWRGEGLFEPQVASP